MDERVICLQGAGRTSQNSQGSGYGENVSFTLNVIDIHGVCYGLSRAIVKGGNGSNGGMPIGENIQPTMQANGAGSVCFQIGGPRNAFCETDKSRTLDTACLQPACNEGGMAIVYPKRTGALCANSHPGSYTGQDAFNDMLPVIKEDKKYVVRRLTPVECSRLQGFPDWWTDGANGSDSNIYKMWGNGIALPCAADVIGRLAKELQKDGDRNG